MCCLDIFVLAQEKSLELHFLVLFLANYFFRSFIPYNNHYFSFSKVIVSLKTSLK